MFIGYPRSGHSLIGSFLDAHPEIVLSHELDALGFINQGVSRDEIFSLILQNTELHSRLGKIWCKYCYPIPDQWQGKYQALKVIGDKKAAVSAMRIGANKKLLSQLLNMFGQNTKIILVARNPFDTITTISSKRNAGLEQAGGFFSRFEIM